MEFIWVGNFLSENFIIKLCKGRVISVRTGLFFLRKFHNSPRVNFLPLILAHSRKIKNSFASSVLNSSFVAKKSCAFACGIASRSVLKPRFCPALEAT